MSNQQADSKAVDAHRGAPDQAADAPQPCTDALPDSEVQNDDPRLVEERHVLGPHGEDEIEATDDQGRRWYHLRPEPRGRADMLGINYTWWTVVSILLLVIVFLPW
jgi:hypothetical protein